MSNENNYVLAMYDVRAKQKFIYRSQHLKEIIGGSAIIRDVFDDHLYDAAIEVRNEWYPRHEGDAKSPAIYNYQGAEAKKDPDRKVQIIKVPEKDQQDITVAEFSHEAFVRRVGESNPQETDEDKVQPQYIGEVVYNGGGNFLVLYKNAEICREVTARFTREVLRATGTLKVICTYIEGVDWEHYVSDKAHQFEGDQQRLYRRHRYTESQETPTAPWGTLPIVQVDYLTSMPLTKFHDEAKERKVSTESYAKYDQYVKERNKAEEELKKAAEHHQDSAGTNQEDQAELGQTHLRIPNQKILDRLVTEKGEESLLAVIYIDGNNMGAKVQDLNADCLDYDHAVTNLRIFSAEIQRIFIDGRLKGIDNATRDTVGKEDDDEGTLRLVVGSGDEITIITNARAALTVAIQYLQKVSKDQTSKGVSMSSCAGISIFHSHTPFADAYRIAEECCETGKRYMKERAATSSDVNSRKAWEDVCMLDFHYNQGAIGVSLDDIRETEETKDISIPWIITDIDRDYVQDKDVTYTEVLQMQQILNLFGRGNTKGLLQAARAGQSALTMEVARIRAHMKKQLADQLGASPYRGLLYETDGLTIREKARHLMIQMIPVYDIWFNKPQESAGTEGKEESND